jgi:hypothetical protein
MVSAGPEPSFVSSVTNLDIASPSVMPRRPPDEAEEEDQDQEEDEVSLLWITAPLELHQPPKNL